ncbi:unnamed protein product [Hyaloperonospora brassicae]|uniref:RxLR effector protein n=1 Tax=Hyaloperonospora brassicae TaxID=162125 RepID=A0AAV0UUY1_HYABA|nr:unnamed protein product [Hyaloperonospora brassicae]
MISPTSDDNSHETVPVQAMIRARGTQGDEDRMGCLSFIDSLVADLKRIISHFHSTNSRPLLMASLERDSNLWHNKVREAKRDEAKALEPIEKQADWKQIMDLNEKLETLWSIPSRGKSPISDLQDYDDSLVAYMAARFIRFKRPTYGTAAEDLLAHLMEKWYKEEKSFDNVLLLLQRRGKYPVPIEYEQLMVLDSYIKYFNKREGKTVGSLVETMLENFGDARSSLIFRRNFATPDDTGLPYRSLKTLMNNWAERGLSPDEVAVMLRHHETSDDLRARSLDISERYQMVAT